MSSRLKRLIGIHFCHVSQDFKQGDSAIYRTGVFQVCGFMIRRRISSMPAGMVITALVVIGLVALAALFLFGGLSDGIPSPGNLTVPTAAPALTGQ